MKKAYSLYLKFKWNYIYIWINLTSQNIFGIGKRAFFEMFQKSIKN